MMRFCIDGIWEGGGSSLLTATGSTEAAKVWQSFNAYAHDRPCI